MICRVVSMLLERCVAKGVNINLFLCVVVQGLFARVLDFCKGYL